MQQKSLRQLAREIGVSASYLSQAMHGKKKLSASVARALAGVNLKSPSVNQMLLSHRGKSTMCTQAEVAELADAADLKSAGAILEGSSPSPGTNWKNK